MTIEAETDRQKFVRLANQRVPKAIKAIRLVGNLANRSNYEYEAADFRKILDALESELKALRSRFTTSKQADEESFHLS